MDIDNMNYAQRCARGFKMNCIDFDTIFDEAYQGAKAIIERFGNTFIVCFDGSQMVFSKHDKTIEGFF